MRKLNTWVSLQYVGSFPDGTIFDDYSTGIPLHVVIGTDSIPRGLEATIVEMELNEERTITISPEAGFGQYESDGIIKIPLSSFPQRDQITVGEYILWFGEMRKKNQPAYAKVVSVNSKMIVLDLNHPLAGKETVYWVKIVDEGSESEREIGAALSWARQQAEEEKISSSEC